MTKFESLVERRENGSCRNIPWTKRAAIMANARAILAETAPAAQREAISPHTSGSELVYKTRVTNDERPPQGRPQA